MRCRQSSPKSLRESNPIPWQTCLGIEVCECICHRNNQAKRNKRACSIPARKRPELNKPFLKESPRISIQKARAARFPPHLSHETECYSQQKSKMSELAHAENGKIYTDTNAGRQRVQRTIGAMQTSVSPDRRRSPWQQAQGGVVDQFGSLGQWDLNCSLAYSSDCVV